MVQAYVAHFRHGQAIHQQNAECYEEVYMFNDFGSTIFPLSEISALVGKLWPRCDQHAFVGLSQQAVLSNAERFSRPVWHQVRAEIF